MSTTSDQLPVPHPIVQDRDGQNWYRWKETCVKPWVADQYARNKHLTDAELAAEYFQQEAKCRHEYWIETVRNIDDDYTDAERAGQLVMEERMNRLYQFAVTPHFNEDGRDV